MPRFTRQQICQHLKLGFLLCLLWGGGVGGLGVGSWGAESWGAESWGGGEGCGFLSKGKQKDNHKL